MFHKEGKDLEKGGGMEGGGWGRNSVLTGMLTYVFSLCLIQCAISRCIIYFCVKSLTSVIRRDDDDDSDDDDDDNSPDSASFSGDKDAMPYRAHATVSCVPTEERPSDLYRK